MKTIFILLCYIVYCSAIRSIVVKPGGVKGYYMTGICKYIRDHYDLKRVKYYGASAGAWNVLYLACKDHKEELFMKQTQEIGQFSYIDLYDMEKTMKKRLVKYFTLNDFDLDKINICVSKKRNMIPFVSKMIISEFEDMDDLVETCIASSHLPWIANGDFFYQYRGNKCFDGGFFNKPYTRKDYVKPSFIITPEMWRNKKINNLNRMYSLDIHKMLYYGYNDAYEHRHELDEIFISNDV